MTPAAAPSYGQEPAPRQVGIGKLLVGSGDEQLRAVLGSCIGIAFLWRKGGRCGLAHCLLPEGGRPTCGPDARYVSQAVPSLLALMGARAADYPDIEVVLAGGASMFGPSSSALQVGRQNIAAARKYLLHCGLQVSTCELGGYRGRTMRVDCASYRCTVNIITHPDLEAVHGYH
ncbi:MAG: chemotaxis protein CheD [Pseudomonadota bacterium]